MRDWMVVVVLPVSSCGVLVCGLFLTALAAAHNSAWEVQIIQKERTERLSLFQHFHLNLWHET